MDEKDPSILGNLPRSRPGTRSEKRAREERTEAAAGRAGPKPKRASKPRAAKPTARAAEKRAVVGAERPAPTTPPRERARRPAPDAADAARVSEPQAPPAGGGPQDAVAGAVKLAGEVASAGVQIGTGLAREVLRRLPGPW